MDKQFRDLRDEINPKRRKRNTSLPLNALQWDDVVLGECAKLLDAKLKERYQSLAGCVGWIVGSIRSDARFEYHMVASMLSGPRMWDLFALVWVMDYLCDKADVPLI